MKPDFFGIHGHTPHGLWADVNVMYDVFDTIAKQGVRLEVTEFVLPLNQISGPVRTSRIRTAPSSRAISRRGCGTSVTGEP